MYGFVVDTTIRFFSDLDYTLCISKLPPPSACKNTDFAGRLIGFAGDSVIYGYSDDKGGEQLDNPWVKEISYLLGCDVVNCGVSSASLLSIDSWTPKAWARDYAEIPKQIDILGFMIGINDCFRGYPLGTMNEQTGQTFYAGLHTLIKGLQKRFPASEGKIIFMIIYPHYDGKKEFSEYVRAMYEVADYYSVPICDLSLILGASPYNDPEYLYWRRYSSNDFHTPHSSHESSPLYARAIANFINSHYAIQA